MIVIQKRFKLNLYQEILMILLLVPPPKLHLLIGPVKREEFHGGSFNGNDSRKLLKKCCLFRGIGFKCPGLCAKIRRSI